MCGAFGPRALPGPSVEWSSPAPEDVSRVHAAEWRSWFGHHDSLAVYRPSQAHRSGVAVLLLRDGGPVGFVKWRPGWDPKTEIDAMSRLGQASTFSSPEVVGLCGEGGWTSLGFTAFPSRIHSPKRVPRVRSIVEEVSELTYIDAPSAVPGWRPMHGDMGPWNLRRMPGIGPVLFDWEHARYAPRYADLVFYAAAGAGLGIDVSVPAGVDEAIAFWQDEIPRRFGGERRDARLAGSMLEALLRLG